MLPVVSVIVPAYNASLTIKETLDSIFNQTFPYFECIVVDDGSSDRVALEQVVQQYQKHSNFTFIQKENGGVSSARNSGAQRAVGEYLMFVDSDDYIDHHYIQKCLDYLKNNPSLGFVCTNVQEFERSKNKIKHKIVELDQFIFHNAVFPCIALMRNADFKSVGGYDERLKVCEDWNLYIDLLSKKSNYYVIPECLYFYRKRNNLSSLTDQIDCNDISLKDALMRIYENHHVLYERKLGTPWDVVEQNNSIIKLVKKNINIINVLILIVIIVFLIKFSLFYFSIVIGFAICYLILTWKLKRVLDGFRF